MKPPLAAALASPALVAPALAATLRGLWQRLRGLRPAPPPGAAPPADLQDAPLDVLVAKIVFSHLRNRQQLLGPPPTALGHLEPAQTELLVRAAVAAATAGGRLTEKGERALRGALSAAGLQPDDPAFIGNAIRRPAPLEVLLREVRDTHMASLVYAASLLASDKHDPVHRAYLHYLATRLHLPGDALARLHSQHGFELAVQG